MINVEKLPNEIFDWIHSTPYQQLNPLQQKVVLAFLDEDQYSELFEATQKLQFDVESPIIDTSDSRDLLVNYFHKQKYSSKIMDLSRRQFIYWQVAAAIFFMLLGWFTYPLLKGKDAANRPLVSFIDTVYINRDIKQSPLVIRDTIIVTKILSSSNKTLYINNTKKQTPLSTNTSVLNQDILSSSTFDLQDEANRPKSNSMLDDSLAKKFGFVAL